MSKRITFVDTKRQRELDIFRIIEKGRQSTCTMSTVVLADVIQKLEPFGRCDFNEFVEISATHATRSRGRKICLP